MLGQIQWMSSSLCNSVLRLSTVERSSSFWEDSNCYTHTHTHIQKISLSYFWLHYFWTRTGKKKKEREREWCRSPAVSPPAASWSLAGELYCCWQCLQLYCDSNPAEETHTWSQFRFSLTSWQTLAVQWLTHSVVEFLQFFFYWLVNGGPVENSMSSSIRTCWKSQQEERTCYYSCWRLKGAFFNL